MFGSITPYHTIAFAAAPFKQYRRSVYTVHTTSDNCRVSWWILIWLICRCLLLPLSRRRLFCVAFVCHGSFSLTQKRKMERSAMNIENIFFRFFFWLGTKSITPNNIMITRNGDGDGANDKQFARVLVIRQYCLELLLLLSDKHAIHYALNIK